MIELPSNIKVDILRGSPNKIKISAVIDTSVPGFGDRPTKGSITIIATEEAFEQCILQWFDLLQQGEPVEPEPVEPEPVEPEPVEPEPVDKEEEIEKEPEPIVEKKKIEKEPMQVNKKKKKRRRRVCDPKEIREWYKQYKSSLSCTLCGKGPEALLCFHHKERSSKEHDICKMIGGAFTREQILEEMSKCDVVCYLCHMRIHRMLPKVPSK